MRVRFAVDVDTEIEVNGVLEGDTVSVPLEEIQKARELALTVEGVREMLYNASQPFRTLRLVS